MVVINGPMTVQLICALPHDQLYNVSFTFSICVRAVCRVLGTRGMNSELPRKLALAAKGGGLGLGLGLPFPLEHL